MAQLDISDALLEPSFQDTLLIHRRTETVTGGGISELSTQVLLGLGVVTPTGDNSMTREDAYTKGARAIEIFTRFRLQGPAPGFQPDVIEWRGNQYVVKVLDDLTNFAQGFVKAECISMDLIEAQPEQFVAQPPLVGQVAFANPDNSALVASL